MLLQKTIKNLDFKFEKISESFYILKHINSYLLFYK